MKLIAFDIPIYPEIHKPKFPSISQSHLHKSLIRI